MPGADRIVATILMAVLLLGGCGPGHDPYEPDTVGSTLPPLAEGRWFLHEVDGQAVPGVVLEPPSGAGLERTQVDSAYFDILPGGFLEYRSWVVRTEADGSAHAVATFATGTWGATSEVYNLRIGNRGSGTIELAPSSGGGLEGNERLPADRGGATMRVLYRSERPPGG